LWNALAEAYGRLGFDGIGDEASKDLVLGRIIEPTSKADTLRVLSDIGVSAPSLRTVYRALARCIDRDYRGTVAHGLPGTFGQDCGGAGVVDPV
jgi:hypothetical protein